MSKEIKAYDLVIIGGGPAGIVAAGTATIFGKSVALVDSHHELGGAGVNTGTVPSKTLRETALTLTGIRSRNLYGVDLSLRREATVADFLLHERNVKAGLNTLLSHHLKASKADVYYGKGRFEDPHTIRVQLYESDQDGRKPASTDNEIVLRGQYILIATGSSPVHPATFPFGDAEIYDSDTILELDCLPKTLAIYGAGVIGSEYACTFAALGAKVHVIDGRELLLPFLDREVSHALTNAMMHQGITFYWKEGIQSCVSSGPDGIKLKLSSGVSLTADALLVAAGRKSNVEDLNLAATGLKLGDHDHINVDEHFRTESPHIYAAGDVIGFPALASTSMEQARRAIRHAFGLKLRSEISHLLPAGVYTIPEVGMVGETEESLHSKGIDYVVGRGPYEANARGRIIGDTKGFLKLLFRRDDMKLLGVHAIGEQATELVHIGLMAMLTGATADIFDEACFNVPTLGELYKYATLNAITHTDGEVAM